MCCWSVWLLVSCELDVEDLVTSDAEVDEIDDPYLTCDLFWSPSPMLPFLESAEVVGLLLLLLLVLLL